MVRFHTYKLTFPNFLVEEGQGHGVGLNVGEMTIEQAREYAEAWKVGFIEHHRRKKTAYNTLTRGPS